MSCVLRSGICQSHSLETACAVRKCLCAWKTEKLGPFVFSNPCTLQMPLLSWFPTENTKETRASCFKKHICYFLKVTHFPVFYLDTLKVCLNKLLTIHPSCQLCWTSPSVCFFVFYVYSQFGIYAIRCFNIL